MHELWLVKGPTMTNITPIVGSISWKSNKDELGDEISFDIAYNDDRYHPVNPCDLGDMIIFKNGDEEITRVIIVDENKSARSPVGYTAFDYAFYLNKSTAIYQFNGITADKAIQKICKDFGVPVGTITPVSTKINKIYNDKKVSDILKDIIQLIEHDKNEDYLLEMRQGKLHMEKLVDQVVKGTFQLAENVWWNDVTAAISSPTKSRSISDTINSIKIVSNDKVILEKSDTASVDKFGTLQKVVSVDEEEKDRAEKIANRELYKLAKIAEDSGLELMGDDRIRARRLLEIEEPITGISGTLLITDATHTISGGNHTVSITLSTEEM